MRGQKGKLIFHHCPSLKRIGLQKKVLKLSIRNHCRPKALFFNATAFFQLMTPSRIIRFELKSHSIKSQREIHQDI